jgi:glycosyltransferase
MFSIITATYNAASSLAHSLESVASQQLTGAFGAGPLEHLIIDGGSTDGTLEILKGCAKPVISDLLLVKGKSTQITNHHSPITRFISEPDKGIYDAMNKGIRMATGDIIGILNADDFYADDRVLERVAKVFEDPEVEACYGDLVYIKSSQESRVRSRESKTGAPRNQDSRLSTVLMTPDLGYEVFRYWKSGLFTPVKMKWGWMPPHPTFFVRRSVYERFGLFNLDLGSAADYELMLRFLLRHRIKTAYIPEVLVCMRAGGVSNASLANRLRANRMDRKAWEVNGLKPYPWTIPMKPVRKIPQYFLKPSRSRL